MNPYERSRQVEAEAMRRLTPFIHERSGTADEPGRFVLIEKGPLAKDLQATIGDVLMTNRKTGRLVSVEIKAEQKHTGNLFIECWSNLNLDSPESWEARGSNPGWAWKLHPGLLFYYFLDVDALYVIKGYALWHWMHCKPSLSNALGASRVHDFRKIRVNSDQMNDTWGHLVPLLVLQNEVGVHHFNPLSLKGEAA